MRFGILGSLVVADDEGRELALGGPKQRSVLAALLLHAGEVVSSDRLIDELWGERASAKAAKTLHVYVSNLRKILGDGWLATRAPGYVLSTDGAEVDVDRFQALVTEGRQALQAGDTRAAVASLREGLGLWRGPPLADLAYESFAQREIARLLEMRLGALEDRIDAELALGGHVPLVGELEALVREHPLRERLRGQLMLALYRSGLQVDALDAYRHARDQLIEQLGLEPGPELRALQSAILNQDPSLTVVVDAGEPSAVPGEPPAREVVVLARQQRKVVTALLCDLVASGELGDQLDPEVLSGVMDRCLEEVRTVIERHGGTVDKFIGDAVMAVFGIPQVREDDALRAVRAAAEILERLPAVADDFRVPLRCRVGINTGLVLVLGEGRKLAIGDAANVAERLAAASTPGEILIGAETLRLVRDAVQVSPLEPLILKGKAAAVAAFRVLEVDRLARGLARRLDAPLVGRERELGWLREVWLRSVQEPGCELVTLLGAAGVGKSRLVAELLASLRQEALVLSGRCLPYGEGITFWPLLEALAPVDGAASQVLERLESGTAAIPEELFLDVRRLLESLARQQPVILCIDDLQWAQPTLLDLLDHLVDLSRGWSILVLCLARPELLDDRPGWAGGKLRATNLLLEPLSVEDCEALANQLDDVLVGEPRSQAVARSEGNPLFLEELVALARKRGPLMLPPTIQALLAARIDLLPIDEREVLERGAVEGEIFHRSAVSALAQTQPSALDLRLASLVRKELIRPHPPTLTGDEAFRFRHLLMRDVVYDGLPKAVRAELHERFARWLLEETPGELLECDEIAGWHLEQAVHYQRELGREIDQGLLVLAADQLRAAGRRARRRADVPAVTSFLERALALAPDGDARRAVISLELAEQLTAARELDRADALLSAAEQDPEASTLAALARFRWLIAAHTSEAYRVRRSTLPGIIERLSRTGDHEALARAHAAGALLHWIQSKGDDTCAEALLAAQHASKAQDSVLREQALGWYVTGLWWGSAPASTIAEEIERLEEQQQPGPYLSSEIDLARAELARFAGRLPEAADLLQRAIDTARALGRRDLVAGHSMGAAHTQLLAGDAAAARETLVSSDAILVELGERGYRSTVQAFLAQAYEQLGQSDQARTAIALTETLGSPDDVINHVITHGVRARLALREGDQDAERWARSAVEHASMTDSIDLQGHTRLQLAEVLASLGRKDEAVQEARAASDLFAAKGDEFARNKAQELLGQLTSMSTPAT